MSRIIVVIVAALSMTVGYANPADACGVKLSVKSPKVKKRVKRTSYPSHILVLGSPPSKRLTRWLKQAGHTVESTKKSSGAKRKDYAIIIADPEKIDEARTNFPKSRVVTRSGTLSSNVRKIERALAGGSAPESRSPVAVASRKATKRTRPAKRTRPSRVRRTQPEPKVETPEPKEETRVAAVDRPEPKEEPEATELTKDEPEADESPEEAEPEPKRKSNARWSKEFFFGSNSSSVSRTSRKRLRSNARWLADNPSVTITIEGHTDSAGPAEYNKVLGERRADSVRAFLVEQGVDESRIEVISYGEERPAYQSDRKNRRVIIVKN